MPAIDAFANQPITYLMLHSAYFFDFRQPRFNMPCVLPEWRYSILHVMPADFDYRLSIFHQYFRHADGPFTPPLRIFPSIIIGLYLQAWGREPGSS